MVIITALIKNTHNALIFVNLAVTKQLNYKAVFIVFFRIGFPRWETFTRPTSDLSLDRLGVLGLREIFTLG